MRTIEVTRIVYTTADRQRRTIPMKIGDRHVELRLRPHMGSSDQARISIITRTNELPDARSGRTKVHVWEIPTGMKSITITGHAVNTMPGNPQSSSYTDEQLRVDILDVIGRVLPEYRLV